MTENEQPSLKDRISAAVESRAAAAWEATADAREWLQEKPNQKVVAISVIMLWGLALTSALVVRRLSRSKRADAANAAPGNKGLDAGDDGALVQEGIVVENVVRIEEGEVGKTSSSRSTPATPSSSSSSSSSASTPAPATGPEALAPAPPSAPTPTFALPPSPSISARSEERDIAERRYRAKRTPLFPPRERHSQRPN